MKTLTYDETKWRLVPVAPTEKMAAAWAVAPAPETIEGIDQNYAYARADWKAMLSAAPQLEPVETQGHDIGWRVLSDEQLAELEVRLLRAEEDVSAQMHYASIQPTNAMKSIEFSAMEYLRRLLDTLKSDRATLASAVRAENEACAEIARDAAINLKADVGMGESIWVGGTGGIIAQAIRARQEGK